MDSDDDESGFAPGLPPALVCLTPFASSFSQSQRRLSSCFTQPSKPVRSKRQLAWVSLQGRLVGADEASSAKTIDRGGAFSAEEAVAWELFTPIQRVLTVAVVAAAAMNSNKNKQIFKLQKSVDLRDQVLLSMQKKLDFLCEQVNYFKDQPEVETQIDVVESGSLYNTSTKGLDGDEVKLLTLNETGPDERRMSDLSDWAPSVTSSVDIQLDSLEIEHDIDSLRKECEEKDSTIMELSKFINSSQVLGSKRIAELEDIIRRKNVIINKLRKDIIILESKMVSQTRLRRSSFPAAHSNMEHFPKMADNLLYDMDVSTDISASDSDRTSLNMRRILSSEKREICVERSERDSRIVGCSEKNVCLPSRAPLGENSHNSLSVCRPKNATYSGGENKSRRRPSKCKDVPLHKRWR